MIPILPANPSTISPILQSMISLKDRLEYLRRLDTYERTTTPERELEKFEIEKQLKETETK